MLVIKIALLDYTVEISMFELIAVWFVGFYHDE